MKTQKLCPDCGSPILPSDGVCPKCLFARASGDSARSGDDSATTVIPGSGSAVGKPDGAGSSGIPVVGGKVQYFGDYELLGEIARGGMGVVYKARQTSLNRVVAVKMILAGQLAGESEVKRFRTEAEAAANLQHPNIVTIHEVGEHEGRHYFSMDLVEGQNLSELVRENPLGAGKAAALVKTIAEAIHYAHQRGTLHRDLKPQNVLMDASGQPHITDFGLAKLTQQDSGVTQTGAVMGSPSYMPPEQASGKHERIGPASDVYSIGAILYELLTGRAPFRAESPLATLQQVLKDEPVAPSRLNPRVPLDLQTICLKCLEKRPEKRYVSARELAEELERFLNHEPIQARPANLLRKVWGWSSRNPWAITGAGTILLLGVLGVAYGLFEKLQHLEWQKTHNGFSPVPRIGGGLLMVILLTTSIAAALQTACLGYMRSRKQLPIGRFQIALGWVAGLCWIGFGFGVVRTGIWEYIWKDHQAGRIVFMAFIGLACGWAGALYLWHVLGSQQVVLFGSDGTDIKSTRTIKVLNPRTHTTLFLSTWSWFFALSYFLITPPDFDEVIKAHPGWEYGSIRSNFLLAAIVAWWWVAQIRGVYWFNPTPGMIVLFGLQSLGVFWMCSMGLGPTPLLQAVIAGLVGGLIQAKYTKVKVTMTTDASAPVENVLDSLFDLIHWNERTLTWIVGGSWLCIIVISTQALGRFFRDPGHFLFIAAISTTCVPLLVSWRAAQPGARDGVRALAATMVLGSLAVACNMAFRTREIPLSTAVGALASGYLFGSVLTLASKWRHRKS